MSRIKTGYYDATYEIDGQMYDQILIDDFDEHVFREFFMKYNPDDEDGRSQVVQIRLPNGDLFLGFAPQGDAYNEIERFFK